MSELNELEMYERDEAERLIKILRRECDCPPEGWHCTRKRGHDGPCAAVPDDPFWMNTMRHDVRDAAKKEPPAMNEAGRKEQDDE